MSRLTEADRHQARAILARMFQYGQDGRDLGRYLLSERGKPDGEYAEMKRELIELLSQLLDDLYTADKPRQA